MIEEHKYPYLWTYLTRFVYSDCADMNRSTATVTYHYKRGPFRENLIDQLVIYIDGKYSGATPIDEVDGWSLYVKEMIGTSCVHERLKLKNRSYRSMEKTLKKNWNKIIEQ